MSLDLTFPPPPVEAPVFCNVNESHLHHGQQIAHIREQNANFGTTLHKMVNPNGENSPRTNKRRKLKSKVWDDFSKYEENNKEWAQCKHCRKKFVGSSKSGTTHLKNHSERCQSKRKSGRVVDKSINQVVVKERSVSDEEFNRFDIVRRIAKYGLSSIKDDILDVFNEEKQKLSRYFVELPCRFNLTIEWHDDVDVCFMVLHFIDDGWELKKRIIHFQYHEYNRDFFEILKCLLLDWNIDINICSIVENAGDDFIHTRDEKFIEINNWLSKQSSLPFFGNCFPVGWLVDKLKITKIYHWKRRLKWTMGVLDEMHRLLDYVRKTSSNENNFLIAVDKAKSMGKKVTSLGVPKHWLWGFELLEWAMGFKEMLFELKQRDSDFELNLTKEEWDKATLLYECREILKDAGRSLSGSKYTTANVYFPKVCDLFMKLLQWEKSDNHYVREIASCVFEEFFDEYWQNSNLILVITVVLDPRFKMDIVERWYNEIYGSDADAHLKKVIDDITNVYKEYAKDSHLKAFNPDCDDGNSSTSKKMLDAMGRPCTSSCHADDILSQETELDRYLKDSKFPAVEEFDILAWWRFNSQIFPTIARMARDLLAIPIYTPDIIDSSLQTEIEDIICCRSLDVEIKQALVYTKIWLYTPEK